MMIWAYAADSIVLHAQNLSGIRGSEVIVAHELSMMWVCFYEVAERMHSSGKEELLTFPEGDELKMMLMGTNGSSRRSI